MNDDIMQQCARLVDTARDIESFVNLYRQLWSAPQSYQTYCLMEAAVDRALEHHPEHLELRIYKTALPAKRQEWSETARRSLVLAREMPNVHWCYVNGLASAQAAAHYDIAHELADLLSAHYTGWTPDILSMLLIGLTQIGVHPVAESIWSYLLREHPTAVSPWLHKRFAWYFHNIKTAPKVRLISLGENCWPWVKLAEWGLRPDADREEEQMPLNCGIQSTTGCIRLLEDNFSDMAHPESLRMLPDATGVPLPYNKKYRFIFNHEAGSAWSDNKFSELHARYERRRNNFNDFAREGPRVYVYYLHRTTAVGNIEDIIENISNDGNYRIVIIDVRLNGEEFEPKNEKTTYLKLNLPWPGFHWVNRASCDQERGVIFEQNIIDKVCSSIQSVSR